VCPSDQIQPRPKPLNRGDGAGLAIDDTAPAGAAALEAQESARVHGEDGAAERVVPGELVAQAVWQREHLLADRHRRQHMVDQVGSALGHPPAATTRTDRAGLA